MQLTVVKAFDLSDAWFRCIKEVLEHGHEWTIQRGSFEGHKRKEFDNICITISNPSVRPLVPDVPEGIPPPTSQRYVDQYLQYLVTGLKEDEEYTYGERITKMLPIDLKEGKDVSSQLDVIIKMLKDTPMTNQACIAVAQPDDVLLKDPPCLRVIDCRIRYDKLHFFVYFRSWDLWAGFPNNMASLQMLKEWIARQIGVEDGTLNAWSKGLHLYDYQYPYANALIHRPPMKRRIMIK